MQAWGLPYENYISRPTSTTLVIDLHIGDPYTVAEELRLL